MEFGDINPDSQPIFGYPLILFTPKDRQLTASEKAKEIWGEFSKQIAFSHGKGDSKKTTIQLMLEKKNHDEEINEMIKKALTYGFKLHNHQVPRLTQQMIRQREKSYVNLFPSRRASIVEPCSDQ